MTMSAVAQRTIRELERLSQSGLDSRVFRHAALRHIRRVVPMDAAFFATTDPTTLLMTSAVTDEILRPRAAQFLHNEFVGDDVNQFRTLARPNRLVSTLDIETGGARERSPRYRDILEPLALGDELRVALAAGRRYWGIMCLHRGLGAGFAAHEVRFMRRASPHLAVGLRTGLLLESVSRGPDPDEPGLLVLAADLSLISANPTAEKLLAEAEDDSWRGQAEVPYAVHGVVGGLIARDKDDVAADAPQPRARMRTATGRWLTLSATWLSGPRPESERQIAVVLETATPIQVWPLVTAAYQLSPRESEVTLLVARGLSTNEISRVLRIANNTVQDYLKSIFDKFGVRSRGQLLAAIFSSQYLPLMPGPNA